MISDDIRAYVLLWILFDNMCLFGSQGSCCCIPLILLDISWKNERQLCYVDFFFGTGVCMHAILRHLIQYLCLDRYPVQAGDVIWMAPFVPQW